jgi:hypothetical protein
MPSFSADGDLALAPLLFIPPPFVYDLMTSREPA